MKISVNDEVNYNAAQLFAAAACLVEAMSNAHMPR
jgi:hypothetical protein